MKRALAGLRTALGVLTILPAGRFSPDPGAAVPWFPWIGWLFGALALAISAAARWAGFASGLEALFAGIAIVFAWAALSRLLHWDGLADTVDGVFGSENPAGRLEVMRDSRVGAFGVFAVVSVFALQSLAGALVYVSGAWTALALAPVAGRLAAVIGVYASPPARTEGFGVSFKDALPVSGWAFAGLALLPALAFGSSDWRSWMLLGVSIACAVAIPLALAKPVGGFTGDTLGASILATETVVLVIAAALMASG